MIETQSTMNLLSALGQAGSDEVQLTGAGAIMMTLSIVLVMGLMVFCLSRILREPHQEEHHHAPLDIDTQDLNGQ